MHHDLLRLRAVFLPAILLGLTQSAAAQVFINEIHYDNDGGDTGEAIELAGSAGTDVTGWSIVRYNGNGGAPYGTDLLSGVLVNQQGGFGTLVIDYPSNGLQNGSPDGVVLVDAGGTVIQFLSYEGTFTAVGGPADGMTSDDIGVTEAGTTPIGQSLQLIGTGTVYADFAWTPHSQTRFATSIRVRHSATAATAAKTPALPLPAVTRQTSRWLSMKLTTISRAQTGQSLSS